MKNLLLVMLGGGLGSGLRYWVSIAIKKHFEKEFPLATFTINLLGCLLIGFIIGYLSKTESGNDSAKLLLATGFCGGFTTFSAFAFENFSLLQSNHIATALLYIGGSIIFGIVAVWAGLMIGKL